ncbi:MAG: hypothetical protein K0Q92_2379 [Steroidobacteraceae bacterium]|nr:hypothetical protein [Steroidobacteraceae bacterium]
MAKMMTDMAPSAMSPTTLAKPIMWTSTVDPCAWTTTASLPWILSRTFSSSARATLMGSMGRPWASFSSTMALMSAPEKSLATRRPRMPALRMFSRTLSSASRVGTNSASTTLPASMPSSTTSM